MKWKEPKNSDLYKWTHHAKEKMKYYGLSETRVRLVLKKPLRIEENFIEGVLLAMQPQSTRVNKKTKEKKWSSEIWVMYKEIDSDVVLNLDVPKKFENLFKKQKQLLIVSAWKYPGVTHSNKDLPIEIENEIYETDF